MSPHHHGLILQQSSGSLVSFRIRQVLISWIPCTCSRWCSCS